MRSSTFAQVGWLLRARVARIVVASIALGSACIAHAQVAAEETLRLTKSRAAPWGGESATKLAAGARLRIAANELRGPKPVECNSASYVFVYTPAEGLFEGQLPAPAQQSAQALGLPEKVVTQRVVCPNASFDLHRAADGRAWLGLDNAMMEWNSTKLAATPEAVVQSLLIHHFTRGIPISQATFDAQRRWLGDAMHAGLQSWLARASSSDEAPYLSGDPFTDSQEPIESFEMASSKASGDRATVVVTFRDASSARTVSYELRKVRNAWRIDDIGYADGERLSELLNR